MICRTFLAVHAALLQQRPQPTQETSLARTSAEIPLILLTMKARSALRAMEATYTYTIMVYCRHKALP
jgi:hypothetical protein